MSLASINIRLTDRRTVLSLGLGRTAGTAVPIRHLLEESPGVFGPEELRDITTAFEAVRKDMGLADRKDPITVMLARLTIELAKQGQFDAASLRDRVLKEMKPKSQVK